MSKAAIVTGASSGIGLAISRVLCEKGYEVYGFGRDFAKEQTREFVEQTAAFHPVEGDLLEEQKLCDAVKEITKTADIEVLVNAAGVGHYGLHEELTPKKIQALVRTNLEIPLLLTNRLLRVLKKNHGYIINISSVTAKQSSPHGCAYAATKAGLSSFGKSLFEEARKYGVKVTTIHPDMTDTNLYRDAYLWNNPGYLPHSDEYIHSSMLFRLHSYEALPQSYPETGLVRGNSLIHQTFQHMN